MVNPLFILFIVGLLSYDFTNAGFTGIDACGL
jgi:hypothetical protein